MAADRMSPPLLSAGSQRTRHSGKYGSPAAQKVNPPCLRHWKKMYRRRTEW